MTGGGAKPVKAPQASQARPAPHCVGRLLRGRSPREKPPLTGEVAAKQAGRALDVSGGGGVKTPPYGAKDKRAVMTRLRAGHARPLRNMVKWDVGRPAPRPPGRLAAMRSHAVCRCRGRRPRRPAEVGGGGRCAGGMNPSPTGYLLAGVRREVAEGSRPLPTM